MKVFMITWVIFCFLVIVGLFIAYATDNFPGVPAPQRVGLDAENSQSGAEEECSPCEENLKRLKKAMEQQTVRGRGAKAATTTASDAP